MSAHPSSHPKNGNVPTNQRGKGGVQGKGKNVKWGVGHIAQQQGSLPGIWHQWEGVTVPLLVKKGKVQNGMVGKAVRSWGGGGRVVLGWQAWLGKEGRLVVAGELPPWVAGSSPPPPACLQPPPGGGPTIIYLSCLLIRQKCVCVCACGGSSYLNPSIPALLGGKGRGQGHTKARHGVGVVV